MPTSHTVKHPAELLEFLLVCHRETKKTKVRQWLKHGSVLVNGQSVTRFNHLLKIGDLVSIRARDERRAESLLPRGMEVVFEDSSLIVIEKPENLLSMASETERENTAYACLTEYVRRGNPRSPERVWIVHRLDRGTSGLMVFARTETAKRTLQNKWRDTEKRYLAVVEGNPPADRGVLKSHLDESGPYKVYSVPPSERTRLAVTHYRVMRRTEFGSLLGLKLETGRRNQIRVHLADAGCPVVGDQKYGARTNPVGRLGLHASFLQFQHPLTQELLTFESTLPPVLSRLV
ncbi:MAG: RluA family pseudouridine synthase [Planctomycetota bacterium]|nr:RluA family pseudouridine synthase [Planctomycetota bacterium]